MPDEPAETPLCELLCAPLASALEERSIRSLKAVQLRSLAPLLQRCDLSVCSPTGSGKTLAYALPLAQLAHGEARSCEACVSLLVLLPTRELAAQTADVLSWVAAAVGLRVLLCAGGAPIAQQEAALGSDSQPPHWVVGTPGRLRDLLARSRLCLAQLRCKVLDEADRLLDEGLAEDTGCVLSRCPPPQRCQSVWLTATYTQALRLCTQSTADRQNA